MLVADQFLSSLAIPVKLPYLTVRRPNAVAYLECFLSC